LTAEIARKGVEKSHPGLHNDEFATTVKGDSG